MQKVFLSSHFNAPTDVDKHDTDLADQVQQLIRSHGLFAVTGDVLGGGGLTPEVMALIDESDALIALMTRRGEPISKAPDRYDTHPWVVGEYVHARAKNKPAIALVEDGVSVGGPYGENEHIKYSRERPLEAFLKLSSTIGKWKQQAGRTIAVRLLPDQVAEVLAMATDTPECEYRCVRRGPNPPPPWKRTPVFPEQGGMFIFVSGMDDNSTVQVRATVGGVVHVSPQTSQYVPVTLKNLGGN